MIKKYFLFLSMLLAVFSAFSQNTQPPYLRFKTVPPAKFVTADSTVWFLKNNLEKKKPLLLIVFSPECDHCKHETEELIANIDKFRDIQVVMATPLPLWQMNDFVKNYNLKKYKNITVVRDHGYFLPAYYDIKSLPYHAFYDKNKKLITGFEGSMTVQKILAAFKGN